MEENKNLKQSVETAGKKSISVRLSDEQKRKLDEVTESIVKGNKGDAVDSMYEAWRLEEKKMSMPEYATAIDNFSIMVNQIKTAYRASLDNIQIADARAQEKVSKKLESKDKTIEILQSSIEGMKLNVKNANDQAEKIKSEASEKMKEAEESKIQAEEKIKEAEQKAKAQEEENIKKYNEKIEDIKMKLSQALNDKTNIQVEYSELFEKDKPLISKIADLERKLIEVQEVADKATANAIKEAGNKIVAETLKIKNEADKRVKNELASYKDEMLSTLDRIENQYKSQILSQQKSIDFMQGELAKKEIKQIPVQQLANQTILAKTTI